MSSDAERYARLHAIFDGARRLAGPALDAFLRAQCQDDGTLRAEVEALLAAASDDTSTTDGFAEVRIAASREALERMMASHAPGDAAWIPGRIAGYQVVRRLGEGGMGVVYEAMQESPRRRVAIKLLHPMQATPERLRRIRNEAEVLGRLHHPGIAQVLEAGTYDVGRGAQPFFAMELVEGVDLRTYCERGRLDIRGRLDLLARVCDAVDYAHQKGVIHRDLKPENILVDEHGQPKVLDFGIARATDDSTLVNSQVTQDGQLLGTLAYMAPEQLRGDQGAITARSDVYGLAVMGFELISGQLPFSVAGLGLATAIKMLQEQEAPPLGTLDRRCRGDVEVIFAHAMEKDPAARYGTAAALAADIRRYLNDEPIQARRPSRIYRIRKVVRRNRGAFSAAALVLLSLVAGLGWALIEKGRADRRAVEQAAAAYRANLMVAGDAVSGGRMNSARQFLDAAPPELRDWAWRYLDARLDPSVRRFDLDVPVTGFAMSADGRTFLVATRDGAIQHRSGTSGALLQELQAPGVPVHCAMRADGGQVVAVGATIDEDPPSVWVAAWSLPDGRALKSHVLDRSFELVGTAADLTFEAAIPVLGRTRCEFDVGRRRLALQAADRLAVLDLDSGAILGSRAVGAWPKSPRLSPDGRFAVIVNGASDPTGRTDQIEILDSTTLQHRGRLAGYHDQISGAAISPDGTRLAVAAMDSTLQMWDLAAATTSEAVGQPLFAVDMRQGQVLHVVFTDDGARVATAGESRTIRWDARSGAPLLDLPSQDEAIAVLDVVHGTDELVSVTARGSVRFWAIDRTSPVVLRGHHSFVYAVDVDRELGLVLTGGWDAYEGKPGTLRLWDLESGDPVATWTEPVMARQTLSDAAFLPGQRAVVMLTSRTSVESLVTRIDLTSGSNRAAHRTGGPTQQYEVRLQSVQPSRTPEAVWTFTLGVPEANLRLLDLGTGQFTWRAAAVPSSTMRARGVWVEHPLAVSPTERFIAVAANATQLAVLRGEDLSVVYEWELPDDEVMAMAFDARERRMLSCSNTGTVRVWDLRSGRQIATLAGDDSGVLCGEFNPAGTTIATGSRDGMLRIWSGESYQQLLSLKEHERYIYALKWQHDGERLLTASGDKTVRIWETQPDLRRYRARDERQALVEKLAPRVDAWLAAHDPAGFGRFLDEATDLTPRERQGARQIMLGRRLGAPAP